MSETRFTLGPFANAHLIAAAPELYEAAQAAERKIAGSYIEKTAADADPVVIALRAALSKANPPENGDT